MYGSNCKAAEGAGASVLHGNRGYYHNDKQPALKAVYQALRDVGKYWTKVVVDDENDRGRRKRGEGEGI